MKIKKINKINKMTLEEVDAAIKGGEIMKPITIVMKIMYFKNGKKYRKLLRNEVIKEGAMQSWHNGELNPIMNTDSKTIGNTPSRFSDERDFYNPIDEPHYFEIAPWKECK